MGVRLPWNFIYPVRANKDTIHRETDRGWIPLCTFLGGFSVQFIRRNHRRVRAYVRQRTCTRNHCKKSRHYVASRLDPVFRLANSTHLTATCSRSPLQLVRRPNDFLQLSLPRDVMRFFFCNYFGFSRKVPVGANTCVHP